MSFSSRNKTLSSAQIDDDSAAQDPMQSRAAPHSGNAQVSPQAATPARTGFGRAPATVAAVVVSASRSVSAGTVGPFESKRPGAHLRMTGDPFRDSRSLMIGERQVLSQGFHWGRVNREQAQSVSIEDAVNEPNAAARPQPSVSAPVASGAQATSGNWGKPVEPVQASSQEPRPATSQDLQYEERYTKSGLAQPAPKTAAGIPDRLQTLIRLVADAKNYSQQRREQLTQFVLDQPQKAETFLKGIYDSDVAPKLAPRVPLIKIAQNHPEAYVFGLVGLEGETPIIVPRTPENAFLKGYHGVSLHTVDAEDSPFPAYTGPLHALGLQAIAAPSLAAVEVPLNAEEALAADAASARAERLKVELEEAQRAHAAAEEEAKAEALTRQANGGAEESSLFDLQDAPDDAFGMDLWDGKSDLPPVEALKSVPVEVAHHAAEPAGSGGQDSMEAASPASPVHAGHTSDPEGHGEVLTAAPESEGPLSPPAPVRMDPWDMSQSQDAWDHLRELDAMDLARMHESDGSKESHFQGNDHAPLDLPDHMNDSVPLDAYLVDDDIAQRALSNRPRRPGA